MSASPQKAGEPYRLAGNRIVFTNWHFVRPAGFSWHDREGRNVSVIGDQGPDEAVFRRRDETGGINLKIETPVSIGPVLTPEKPWETDGVSVGAVLTDGGIYKIWAMNNWGDLKNKGGRHFLYYESEDGMHWTRPNCGVYDYNGEKNNNILCESLGGTVFIDPSAPPEERYKAVGERLFTEAVYRRYAMRRPDAVDWKSYRAHIDRYIGVAGLVSPDGIHWTELDDPIAMMHSDTHIVACYDAQLKKYVGYFRDWSVGDQAEGYDNPEREFWMIAARRAIGRSETDDFRNFPLSKLIVEPRPDMGPSKVLYTNCYTTVPGAPDIRLMFPAVWDLCTDTTAIEALSSSDGCVWNFMTNGPLLEAGVPGTWDGGCIFAVPNLIELPSGDFALPYTGYSVPHKYPRQKAQRAMGYKIWNKGRFSAIEAKEEGYFTTVAITSPGERLYINAVVKRAGAITVEAADMHGKTIPGREFENCVPIAGDAFRQIVAWNGQDCLGVSPGQPVILRFRMNHAAVYALDFQ